MTEEDASILKAYGWIWLGFPAVLGWLAYGLAWLLAPRLTEAVEPIIWSGAAVGFYYGACLTIAFVFSLGR